jgi:hypothetical protein
VGDKEVVDAENRDVGVKIRSLSNYKKYIQYTKVYVSTYLSLHIFNCHTNLLFSQRP